MADWKEINPTIKIQQTKSLEIMYVRKFYQEA
jgi:hypothetical protein